MPFFQLSCAILIMCPCFCGVCTFYTTDAGLPPHHYHYYPCSPAHSTVYTDTSTRQLLPTRHWFYTACSGRLKPEHAAGLPPPLVWLRTFSFLNRTLLLLAVTLAAWRVHGSCPTPGHRYLLRLPYRLYPGLPAALDGFGLKFSGLPYLSLCQATLRHGFK